jgi:hypothetical protein
MISTSTKTKRLTTPRGSFVAYPFNRKKIHANTVDNFYKWIKQEATTDQFLVIAKDTWNNILDKRPTAVKEQMQHCNITQPFIKQCLKDWLLWRSSDASHIDPSNPNANTLFYEDDMFGQEKLLKHAFKYHIHKQTNWRVVGHAAFATGDTTCASIALHLDPELEIKTYAGTRAENANTLIESPPHPLNPKTDVDPIYLSPTKENQVTTKYGTQEKTNKEKFKKYSGNETISNENPRKPWLHHISETTDTVAKNLTPQSKVSHLRFNLIPDDIKEKIKNYFDQLNIPENGFIIWGRTTGSNEGGAHPELDTNNIVFKQLIDHLHTLKKDAPIVLMGDAVFNNIPDTKAYHHLEEIWKKEQAPFLNHLLYQEYFKFLFTQKGFISLGMRSGILENTALCSNMPTIYFDDKDCTKNDAGLRIQALCGTAAHHRHKFISTSQPDTFDPYEKAHAGPVPHLKRVITRSLLGSANSFSEDLNNAIETIDAISEKISGTRSEFIINKPKEWDKTKTQIQDLFKSRNQHWRISPSSSEQSYKILIPDLIETINNKINKFFSDQRLREGQTLARKTKPPADMVSKGEALELLRKYRIYLCRLSRRPDRFTENELAQITHLVKHLSLH